MVRTSAAPTRRPLALRHLLVVVAVAALLSLAIIAAAANGQTRKPGVGYTIPEGTLSHAGDTAGCPAVRIDTAVDPWDGRISGSGDPAKMAQRYGECWIVGTSGPHSNDYRTYLREDFAARVARWNPDYSLYDGNPTEKEMDDAYYSHDVRVLPLTAGGSSGGRRRPPTEPPPAATPAPTAQPTPAPAPTPTPAPAATPCPATTPQPPAPAYVAMPAEHRQTFLAAPYWKKPYTPERKRAINAAADWVKAHPGGWFVPQVGSTGIGATTTIEPCAKVGVTRDGRVRWDCGGVTFEAAP